jgi:hypothetical protein
MVADDLTRQRDDIGTVPLSELHLLAPIMEE